MTNNISAEDKKVLIDDLITEYGGKLDGSRRNILIPECPFCGHGGYKYGIYIGKETNKYKKFGSSNCFHCGRSFRTLGDTLKALNHEEWLPQETTDLEETVTINLFDDEIDDSLIEIKMPAGYKRTRKNKYLKSRGFTADDYEYFPCGTTRGMNSKYDDYVLLEVRDEGRLVGFVGRHTWEKSDIDCWNDHHRYQIRRYNNSTENMFSKLLYNYDAIKMYETDTVVLCEGPFDVIGLNQKMELYDYSQVVPVATFGKKISECQMMKLQQKGVDKIVIGYDNDEAARESIGKVAAQLENYFDVFCIQFPGDTGKDFGDMDAEDIYLAFSECLVTPREFNLNVSL